eukprot:CAMPEP_0184670732 /NCGR_PEP_ID=MMETSP0308-20130426/83602_1 /TAXON_ID=38269 /ORGANISM="Gloeochaete witrockiana, Strain SAG 46.84" /LENGTH=623 /DNA_ID=CAMNT_0027117589 /DNA_START=213 /DNA_END=2084 /DNA_ORIENTATION=+
MISTLVSNQNKISVAIVFLILTISFAHAQDGDDIKLGLPFPLQFYSNFAGVSLVACYPDDAIFGRYERVPSNVSIPMDAPHASSNETFPLAFEERVSTTEIEEHNLQSYRDPHWRALRAAPVPLKPTATRSRLPLNNSPRPTLRLLLTPRSSLKSTPSQSRIRTPTRTGSPVRTPSRARTPSRSHTRTPSKRPTVRPWSASSTIQRLVNEQAAVINRWGLRGLNASLWSARDRSLTKSLFWEAFFRPTRPLVVGVTGGSSTAGYGVGWNVSYITLFVDWLSDVLPANYPPELRNAAQPSTGTLLSYPCMEQYVGSKVDLLFWEHIINDFLMRTARPEVMNLWLGHANAIYPNTALGVVYLWDSPANLGVIKTTAQAAVHPSVVDMGNKGKDIFSVSLGTLVQVDRLVPSNYVLDLHHPNVRGHRVLLDLLKFAYIPMFLDILRNPCSPPAFFPKVVAPPPIPSYSYETSLIFNATFTYYWSACYLTLNPVWGFRGQYVVYPVTWLIRSSDPPDLLIFNWKMKVPQCKPDLSEHLNVRIYADIFALAVQSQQPLRAWNPKTRQMYPPATTDQVPPWLMAGASSPVRWFFIPKPAVFKNYFDIYLCCNDCVPFGATLGIVVYKRW